MRRPSPSTRVLAAVVAALVVVGAGIAAAALAASGSRAPSAGTTGTSFASTPRSSSTTAPSTAPTTTAPGGATAPPHVMVILMENHGYNAIIGNPTAPFINSLATRYGLATASYATGHPSLPNYLSLVSGSTQGISTDCTTCTVNGRQVVDQLQAAGIGWNAYMESAPRPCYTGTAPPFDRHHDPFVYAPHIVNNPAECDRVVPLSALAPALRAGTAPPFIWITPNVNHDMHTGSVRQGDAWLRATLTMVQASSWYHDGGAIFVTWDEGTTSAGCCGGAAGGRVATIVVSDRTPAGSRLATPVDHAGLLRTIEALYHLPYLGAAADHRSGTLLPLLGGRPATG